MAYVTPGTVAAGDVATAAAWNVVVEDIIDLAATRTANQAVWTDFTPTITQGVSVTVTKNRARFLQIGKTIYYNVSLVATTTGTSGTAIIINGLITPANTSGWASLGTGVVVVGGNRYAGTLVSFGGSAPFFQVGTSGDALGSSPTTQLVNTSTISFQAVYEIA
jgi:hypothetical protein